MPIHLPAGDALGVARELILRPGGLEMRAWDQVSAKRMRHRVAIRRSLIFR